MRLETEGKSNRAMPSPELQGVTVQRWLLEALDTQDGTRVEVRSVNRWTAGQGSGAGRRRLGSTQGELPSTSSSSKGPASLDLLILKEEWRSQAIFSYGSILPVYVMGYYYKGLLLLMLQIDSFSFQDPAQRDSPLWHKLSSSQQRKMRPQTLKTLLSSNSCNLVAWFTSTHMLLARAEVLASPEPVH